jgi:hypothetical protein
VSIRDGFTLGGLTVRPCTKPSNSYMGRFGGGWQWKLGFQCGNFTREYGFEAIVSLLVFEYRVTYRTKNNPNRTKEKVSL